MNRAILIKDQNDQLVGELMAASEADVVGTLGVSDGSIIME